MRLGGIASRTRLLAGLALVVTAAASAGAETDWARAHPVPVIASEYKFSPATLVFRHGVAYRLHIENRGKELHEFTAPEFFKSVVLRNPEVLNAGKTEIEIPPGTARDVFFVALRAGHFGLRCSDHDWAGMTGAITVR